MTKLTFCYQINLLFLVWMIPFPVFKTFFGILRSNGKYLVKKNLLIRGLEAREIIPFPVWIIHSATHSYTQHRTASYSFAQLHIEFRQCFLFLLHSWFSQGSERMCLCILTLFWTILFFLWFNQKSFFRLHTKFSQCLTIFLKCSWFISNKTVISDNSNFSQWLTIINIF